MPGWHQANPDLSQPEEPQRWTGGGVGCMELAGGEWCSGPKEMWKNPPSDAKENGK